MKLHPLIKKTLNKQLEEGSFWYRQHYKLAVNDPIFLDSDDIDWRLDYEGVLRLQEQANGKGASLEVETDEDLSEVDMENDEYWDQLMKEDDGRTY
jgi:hypothetical protein